MFKFDNILVPTDFSKQFYYALDYAKGMARSTGSTLHIVHSIETTLMPHDMVFHPHAKLVDVEQEIQRQTKEKLLKLKESLESEGFKVKTEVTKGAASSEIVKYAGENDIDAICISTHGTSGLEHFIFGSTTEKVLRTAKCPVIAVKMQEDE